MSETEPPPGLPGLGLRVGIVGGGFMAAVHSRAVRASGARLVGIVSSTPQKSARAAEMLGIERPYGTVEELVSSDLDVVHICTPNTLHAEQARLALDAGRHVVCEKPLAVSVAQARQLVAEAEDRARVAVVPFVYRYHPLVREARARFRDGTAGRVLTIQGSYLQDWLLGEQADDWRVDDSRGGASRAFADIGSHLVDLIEFIGGDRLARLSAVTRTFFSHRAHHPDVRTEDAVAVSFETEGGAIGTLLVSQVAAGRKNALRIEIAGSEESVAFDQEQPETLWVGRRSGSLLLPRDADQIHDDAARLCATPAGHPQGYQDAFTALVGDAYAAVHGADPVGLPRFADGLRAVELTAAVMESRKGARPVEVRSHSERAGSAE